MTKRAEQYKETRGRIVKAAVEAFSELGFRGASTREIAARAGTNQGLVTYHFRSKDELWRAAVDEVFTQLRSELTLDAPLAAGGEEVSAEEATRERARHALRQYVRFTAAHPELFRLMVDEGKTNDERMSWLVDERLKPFYEAVTAMLNEHRPPGADTTRTPHAFYALAGAASLMFAVAPECRRLTGLEPTDSETIEAHADFLARLFVPD